jgi:hypothetical protein
MFYNDQSGGVHFDNPVVTGLVFGDNTITMSGAVRALGTRGGNVTFTVTITVNPSPAADQISVALSNGYAVAGKVTSGKISIL